MPRTLLIAACAPRTINIGSTRANPATVRMLAGRETDLARIRAHAARFIRHHLHLLRQAGAAGAEVAVIPEDCLRMSSLIAAHGAEAWCCDAVADAHESFMHEIGAVCRRYRMSVVAGSMTTRDGRYYNSALMLDPAGAIVAAYDKTHLPPGETACITPGDRLPVFDTHLGRVGLLICWDIVFPEPFATLALHGAEIIFQPTFGHWDESHDITARCRAMDWSVPLVIGMWGGCACIIDHDGNFAARSGRVGDSLALAPLTLGAPRKWLFMEDARVQKPAMRRPELYCG